MSDVNKISKNNASLKKNNKKVTKKTDSEPNSVHDAAKTKKVKPKNDGIFPKCECNHL